jgi:hypothetical protein
MEERLMLSLYHEASIEAALLQPLAPMLRKLIEKHLCLAKQGGLSELTHIVVVQPGDTEAAIAEEIGFSPLVNPIDGARFGTAEWTPYWAWLQRHPGWHEMIVTVGDSGFAFILLIEDAAGVLPELLRLCDEHAEGAS